MKRYIQHTRGIFKFGTIGNVCSRPCAHFDNVYLSSLVVVFFVYYVIILSNIVLSAAEIMSSYLVGWDALGFVEQIKIS